MEETAPSTDAAAAEAAPSSLDEALGNEGELIDEIQQSLGDGDGADAGAQPVAKIELQELHGNGSAAGATMRDLDLLADVEVEVAVEFGRTRIPLRQLLTLRRGALVELNRRPEQQVTVLANGTPIALGDVVVVDDQIGVHIVELLEPKAPTVEPEDMELPLTQVVDDGSGSAAPPMAGAPTPEAGDLPTADGSSESGTGGN